MVKSVCRFDLETKRTNRCSLLESYFKIYGTMKIVVTLFAANMKKKVKIGLAWITNNLHLLLTHHGKTTTADPLDPLARIELPGMMMMMLFSGDLIGP